MAKNTITLDERQPLRFANYNGDVRHMLGEIHGPNALGEYMVAVEVTFDDKKNKSRTGFAFATTHDIQKAVQVVRGQ